jgi:hypothetical protein
MTQAHHAPRPASLEQALEAVERSMKTPEMRWPQSWRREYVDTIRAAVTSDPNGKPSPWHVKALRQGFPLYREGLKTSDDRASFELHLAEIRWYTEQLMRAAPPRDSQERQRRDQWKRLWDHATSSLRTQFPFLDPNLVQKARAHHLALCYRHMEAPLLPVFLRSFSEAQMNQIKQRWHELRYARVDIWYQLGGEAMVSLQSHAVAPLTAHPHYQLSRRSLEQWLPHIQAIALAPPDYYRHALRSLAAAERRRRRLLSQAWAAEKRLEREYGGQLLQTEHLSFLLAALLETTASSSKTPCMDAQGRSPCGREAGASERR